MLERHVFAIYCISFAGEFFVWPFSLIFHNLVLVLVLVLILILILLVRLLPVESAAIFLGFNMCLTLILWSMLWTCTYDIKMCVCVYGSVNVTCHLSRRLVRNCAKIHVHRNGINNDSNNNNKNKSKKSNNACKCSYHFSVYSWW